MHRCYLSRFSWIVEIEIDVSPTPGIHCARGILLILRTWYVLAFIVYCVMLAFNTVLNQLEVFLIHEDLLDKCNSTCGILALDRDNGHILFCRGEHGYSILVVVGNKFNFPVLISFFFNPCYISGPLVCVLSAYYSSSLSCFKVFGKVILCRQ